jgi:hypothetical protein
MSNKSALAGSLVCIIVGFQLIGTNHAFIGCSSVGIGLACIGVLLWKRIFREEEPPV